VSITFRPEVADAQRQQWLGQVQLVRPMALSLFSVGVLCALLLIGAFLFFGEYTRKARIGGVLIPDLGVIRLVPPVPGRVLQRHVVEGQVVQAGEVMFVLALEGSTLPADVQARVKQSLDERRRSLQDAARQQAQLADAQATALDRRLEEMKRERTNMAHRDKPPAVVCKGDRHAQTVRSAQLGLEAPEPLRASSPNQA
jgi:membrane fusion protein